MVFVVFRWQGWGFLIRYLFYQFLRFLFVKRRSKFVGGSVLFYTCHNRSWSHSVQLNEVVNDCSNSWKGEFVLLSNLNGIWQMYSNSSRIFNSSLACLEKRCTVGKILFFLFLFWEGQEAPLSWQWKIESVLFLENSSWGFECSLIFRCVLASL